MNSPEYRRILVIKPGAMGDLLHLTPAIRALKSRYPSALIDIMVGNTPSIDLFRHHPAINATLVFNRWGEHKSLVSLIPLWRRIRAGRYDLVINFQRANLRSWLLTLAAFPCKVLIYHKSRTRNIHAVADHFETLSPLGVTMDQPTLDFYVGEADQAWARQCLDTALPDRPPLVAMNLGASNRIKCWSPEGFAALANRLGEHGIATILIGGKIERDLADQVISRLTRSCLDLVGTLTMGQLGGVLSRCDVLVSGDTGPLHLATAVRTPVVALFGAIDPDRTGPVGANAVVLRHPEIPCVPCNARSCVNRMPLECMQRITVDEVHTSVMTLLEKRRPCAS